MSIALSPGDIAQMQNRYSYLVNYQADDPTTPIDPMAYRSSDGDSLLHIAAQNGDAQTVELLLKAGIDPNLLGDMGSTPLHYAKANQRTETARLLISYGARADIRNEFGKVP
jgi:ankyrin repeat protein